MPAAEKFEELKQQLHHQQQEQQQRRQEYGGGGGRDGYNNANQGYNGNYAGRRKVTV